MFCFVKCNLQTNDYCVFWFRCFWFAIRYWFPIFSNMTLVNQYPLFCKNMQQATFAYWATKNNLGMWKIFGHRMWFSIAVVNMFCFVKCNLQTNDSCVFWFRCFWFANGGFCLKISKHRYTNILYYVSQRYIDINWTLVTVFSSQLTVLT
jgi:hypothetical protein